MNDIEQKALALVNEVETERGMSEWTDVCRSELTMGEALCRAIEQHEAFRQEVSDAIYVDVVAQVRCGIDPKFRTNSVRFVITKPDPLVEAIEEIEAWPPTPDQLVAALAKHGGKIVWENSDA